MTLLLKTGYMQFVSGYLDDKYVAMDTGYYIHDLCSLYLDIQMINMKLQLWIQDTEYMQFISGYLDDKYEAITVDTGYQIYVVYIWMFR